MGKWNRIFSKCEHPMFCISLGQISKPLSLSVLPRPPTTVLSLHPSGMITSIPVALISFFAGDFRLHL